MNRLDHFPRAIRKVTASASARFTYLAEANGRTIEPTATELQELERAYNATGEYLIDCAEFNGLVEQVHAQGSRQMGTIVRPMDANREGFDIDLVVRLSKAALVRYGGPGGAALLLEHLYVVLKRYAERHGLGIERWDRCVTLVYSGGMRADFAPVIDDPLHVLPYGKHHGRIPDRDLRNYLSTNPKGYCLGFDAAAEVSPVFRLTEALTSDFAEARKADLVPLPEADEVFARLLSRFVQLGKMHRNVSFGEFEAGSDIAPTSVFLTSLFAKAYVILAPKPHDGPLDLFFDIVELLPDLFEREIFQSGKEIWTLMNPCAQADNLAASMNDSKRQQAFSQWQKKFVTDLDGLLAAIEGNNGLDTVSKAVETAFGQRAKQAVLQHSAQRRESFRSLKQAGFVIAGAASVVSPARAHTYFGGPSD